MGVVVDVAVGAAVVFIVWGTVLSLRRRRRLMHATGPNFESFAGFYNSNPLRRGDDVNLAHIDDQGYRWDVSWLPGTREVAAFCVGWSDEQAHLHTNARGGLTQLYATPQLVRLLGSAATADQASEHVAGRHGLDDIRATFSD